MSKVLRELESIWGSDTCSESTNTIPERFRPLVAFLKAPERGLPVINGVSAWLKAVEHWSEAARFLNCCANHGASSVGDYQLQSKTIPHVTKVERQVTESQLASEVVLTPKHVLQYCIELISPQLHARL